MPLFQKSGWVRWGLSCLNDPDTIRCNEKCHDLVAGYLAGRPEMHQEWDRENIGYIDVLVLAKREIDGENHGSQHTDQ